MITEKTFCLGFSAFWHELLPRLESYVRARNLQLSRYLPPLRSSLRAGERGLTNEIAFRLYAASIVDGRSVGSLPPDRVESCVAEALAHIRGLRQFARQPVIAPFSTHLSEAHQLAERTALFFEAVVKSRPIVSPKFLGCGWLDECAGDALASPVLYEIKAGHRGIRSVDIRQILCYCALNFASKSYVIEKVCLMNPRMGVYFEEPLTNLCAEAAGASAVEVLADIIEFCCESDGRDGDA